jgi:hypothetical protein
MHRVELNVPSDSTTNSAALTKTCQGIDDSENKWPPGMKMTRP